MVYSSFPVASIELWEVMPVGDDDDDFWFNCPSSLRGM